MMSHHERIFRSIIGCRLPELDHKLGTYAQVANWKVKYILDLSKIFVERTVDRPDTKAMCCIGLGYTYFF